MDYRKLDEIHNIFVTNIYDNSYRKPMRLKVVKEGVTDKIFESTISKCYLNAKLLNRFSKDIDVYDWLDSLLFKPKIEDKKTVMKKYISQYMSKMLDVYKQAYPIGKHGCLEKYQDIAADVMDIFIKHSAYFDNIYTYDISLYDLYELFDEDPEAEEIMLNDNHINSDMTPEEIVTKKNVLSDVLGEKIFKHKTQPFYTLLKGGAGMRMAQYIDSTLFIGCNPLGHNIIPYDIPESWLRGLSTDGSIFAQNASARIAKKLEKIDISSTGYDLKRAMFAMKNITVKANSDCGSIHLIPRTVDILKNYIGKWYKESLADINYKQVTEADVQLKGKQLYFRDPITCATVEGHICSKCMGIPVRENFDIGLYIATEIYGAAGQAYLSAKHNNIATPVDIFKDYKDFVKLTIKEKLVFKTPPKKIIFIQPTVLTGPKDDQNRLTTKLIYVDGKEVKIKADVNTHFYTPKGNLHEDGEVIDMSKVYCKNVNIPKANLYLDLKKLYFSQTQNTTLQQINFIYSVIGQQFHMSEIGILTYAHVRDATNPYRRPDFSMPTVETMFVSMPTILGYLPVTESLPHGVKILENLLTAPETYNGSRKESNKMDIILIPRKV